VIRHKPSSVSGLLQLPRDHPGRLDTVRSGLGRLAGTARSPRQARRCNGQALAYVYFEDEPGRLTVANRSPAMKRGELLPAFPVAGAAAGRAAARLTGGLPMGDSIGGRAKGLPTTLGERRNPLRVDAKRSGPIDQHQIRTLHIDTRPVATLSEATFPLNCDAAAPLVAPLVCG
jgi:hypothetical protein